jgi:hypothetical protein
MTDPNQVSWRYRAIEKDILGEPFPKKAGQGKWRGWAHSFLL